MFSGFFMRQKFTFWYYSQNIFYLLVKWLLYGFDGFVKTVAFSNKCCAFWLMYAYPPECQFGCDSFCFAAMGSSRPSPNPKEHGKFMKSDIRVWLQCFPCCFHCGIPFILTLLAWSRIWWLIVMLMMNITTAVDCQRSYTLAFCAEGSMYQP